MTDIMPYSHVGLQTSPSVRRDSSFPVRQRRPRIRAVSDCFAFSSFVCSLPSTPNLPRRSTRSGPVLARAYGRLVRARAPASWALLQVLGFAADAFAWPVITKPLAMLALAALRSAEAAGWRGPFWRYYRDFDPNLDPIRNEPEFKAVFTDIERDMAQQRARLAARPKDAPLDLAVR